MWKEIQMWETVDIPQQDTNDGSPLSGAIVMPYVPFAWSLNLQNHEHLMMPLRFSKWQESLHMRINKRMTTQ
jgi:hypothetical protein